MIKDTKMKNLLQKVIFVTFESPCITYHFSAFIFKQLCAVYGQFACDN